MLLEIVTSGGLSRSSKRSSVMQARIWPFLTSWPKERLTSHAAPSALSASSRGAARWRRSRRGRAAHAPPPFFVFHDVLAVDRHVAPSPARGIRVGAQQPSRKDRLGVSRAVAIGAAYRRQVTVGRGDHELALEAARTPGAGSARVPELPSVVRVARPRDRANRAASHGGCQSGREQAPHITRLRAA